MTRTVWSTPSTGATPDSSMRLPSKSRPGRSDAGVPLTPRTRFCHLSRRKATVRFAAVTIAALTLVGAAAASPIYWTPAKAAAAIQTQRLTLPTPINGSTYAAVLQTAPTCKGNGRPVKGRFQAFTCTATAKPYGADEPLVQLTIYVRPWADRSTCISAVGAAVCSTPRAAADPRVCGKPRMNVDYCLAGNARAALRKTGTALICQPERPFVFTCQGDVVYTVAWKAATGWTVTP